MSNLENAVRETLCYKLFVNRGIKHIYEDEFVNLRNNIIKEAWGHCQEHSFSGAMAWTMPKQNAVKIVLKEDGVFIHMNAEYEEMFAEWYKQQGQGPTNFPASLEWYSTKRQEFDEIYQKEKECWDSKTS